jgi:hypothetical protein
VPAHRPEQLADEPLGRPGRKRDRTAGPADPQQLGRSALLVGREHHADDGHDGVERRVGVRQLLRVAVLEVDREPFGGGPRPTAVEQLGYVVDAGHHAAASRGGDGGVAGTGGDVQYVRAGG